MNKLEKHLNLTDLTLLSASTIIGGGIFTILSTAMLYSKEFTWIAAILAGLITLLSGISYSKLSKLSNDNSSEYTFIEKAFSKKLAIFSSILLISGIILAGSVVSIGFGNYLSSIIPMSPKIMSIVATSVFGLSNLIKNKTLIQFNNKTAILEISGLVTISAVALFTSTSSKFPFPLPPNTSPTYKSILYSTFLLSFAYWGYESILASNEESINPTIDIPKAIIYSIVLVTVLYTVLAAATVSILSPELLATSKYPIVHLAQALFGNIGYYIFSILAIISLGNGIITLIMGSSRLLQRITTKLDILPSLRYIDPDRKTPDYSIFTITVLSIICILFLTLEPMVKYANIMWFIILILTNLSAIKLQVIHPIIPGLGILSTVILSSYYLWK
jgi:basic amino acid/polyamine antiporter, APA family